jgi:photosystem II stability/assembly factor-like uncharacterized protein
MAIALSHGGSTIYSSPSPSQEVLVGTREGVVTIERPASGSEWRVKHRALTDKHISAIIKEPESGLTFAGAFSGSVHVSADNGKTWELRGSGLTETNVYSLASRRVNGRVRLFAGTEPAHLFASDDLGLNWSEMSSLRSVPSVPKWSFPAPPHIGHVKHINFDPDNPTTTYASVEVGGLLKSTDAGEHWEEFPSLYEDVHRLMIHPSNPKFLYAVTGRGLYVSPLPDRLQASIEAFCLEEAGGASSIFAATTSGEIFCSEDLGEHWNKIISGLAPISKAGHYRNLAAA